MFDLSCANFIENYFQSRTVCPVTIMVLLKFYKNGTADFLHSSTFSYNRNDNNNKRVILRMHSLRNKRKYSKKREKISPPS